MLTEMTIRVQAQPFFAGWPAALIRELCECATPDAFPAGAAVFAEGGSAEAFWLLEAGTVALGLHGPARGDEVIETIGPGTVLGWSWLHPPYRWHFGATAIEDVAAVRFDAARVRLRCETDPEFGYAMLSRFTPVIIDRLQTARLRLLDLWGAS
ncbi:MAG TPA: cyclic nucleotide-binding domain-containing protein [Actinoplanes sp.]|nr:cyclic nucleotide-binding domain-containing protein [Actinoplanes sp.]